MLRIDDRHDHVPSRSRGSAAPAPPAPPARDAHGGSGGDGEARRALRRQIARLERDLADALVAAFPTTPDVDVAVAAPRGLAGPRVLSLAALEELRDDLVAKLQEARRTIDEAGAAHERNRALLEEMLREPERHKFRRLPNRALGERGCGVWEVRPRLGIIGMMMGWWHVKLSSGCPLDRSSP